MIYQYQNTCEGWQKKTNKKRQKRFLRFDGR